MILDLFEEAYQLFLAKAAKENIKRLGAYDKKFMIHYPIIEFLDGYLLRLYKTYKKHYHKEYLVQEIDIITEILDGFVLERGYKAY